MEPISSNVAAAGTTAAKAALLATPMLLKTQFGLERYHFSIGRNGLLKGPYDSASSALAEVRTRVKEPEPGLLYLVKDQLYLQRDQIETLRLHPKAIHASFLHDIMLDSDYRIHLWRIDLNYLTAIYLYQETLLHQETYSRETSANLPRLRRPLTLYGYYTTIESLHKFASDYSKQKKQSFEERKEQHRMYNALKQENVMSYQTTGVSTLGPSANTQYSPYLYKDSVNLIKTGLEPKRKARIKLELAVALERTMQDYNNQTEAMLAGLRANADDALSFISEQTVTLIPETNVKVLNNTIAVWHIPLGKAKSWFYRTASGNLSGPLDDLATVVKYVLREDYICSEIKWPISKWASFTRSKVLPVTDEKASFVAWCVSIADLEPFYIFSRFNRAIPVLIVKKEEEVIPELQKLCDLPSHRPGWRAWGSTSPILID